MTERASISLANKGKALARRIQELKRGGSKITEPWIAKQLNKTRGSVANWKAGNNWPSVTEEEKLESVLSLPSGFFSRIGAGQIYEEALKVLETVSDDDLSIEQYRQLLLLAPTDPNTRARVERVRSHLRNQIQMLAELLMVERGMFPPPAKKTPDEPGETPINKIKGGI